MEKTEQSWGPRSAPRGAAGLSAARTQVLDVVRSRPEPWTVQELVEVLDAHPNTVREHLSGLVSRGLIEATPEKPRGRGRPSLTYRALSNRTASGCLELAVALADHLGRLPDSEQHARAAGRAWAQTHVGPPPDKDAGDVMWATLVGMDLDPEAQPDGSYLLRRCPLLAAVRRNEVICQVSQGMIEQRLRQAGFQGQFSVQPMGHPQGCIMRLDEGDV